MYKKVVFWVTSSWQLVNSILMSFLVTDFALSIHKKPFEKEINKNFTIQQFCFITCNVGLIFHGRSWPGFCLDFWIDYKAVLLYLQVWIVTSPLANTINFKR